MSSGGEKRPGPMAQTNQVWGPAIYGLPVADTENYHLAVSDADRRNAIDFPNDGWAPLARLYNLDTPPQPLRNVASRADPRLSVDPSATHDRECGRDIVSRALVAANAVRVDPSEWLMMNDDGATAKPLRGWDFED